jgi:hypothetical protein
MNNMGREIMAALKRFQVGSDGDGVTVGGALVVSGATTANTFSATAVNATGTVTFSGSVILSGTTTANTFSTDLITEKTSAAGVTIDSVLLKDGLVNSITVGRGGGAVSTNTAVGASALAANEAGGTNNTAIGYQALDANTTGDGNTAVGDSALGANTTGSEATAVGYQAGFTVNGGTRFTAVGYQAAYTNTANNMTAIGHKAAFANTSGGENTAIGALALTANTTASDNVAVGVSALSSNTTGGSNTALGKDALQQNTTASNNTAVGYQAGYTNSTGTDNTFVGYQAGYSSAVSSDTAYNVCVGANAGYSLTSGRLNTYVGHFAGNLMTSGSSNTIIGRYDGNQGGLDIRTASNYIVLSDGGGSPRIYIAGTNGYFFPNIRSSAAANNDLRFNTGNGEIYYQTSSQRYKENIVDLEFDTSNLYNLRPVSYDDKATGNRCYGLIAEETFAQIPDVVVKRDIDGESLPDSIPYSMLSVVIINEMKKLKTLVDELSAQVTALQAEVNALKGQ